MNKAPDILKFSNYRKFLKERYSYLHQKDRNFSYLYCANKIGVSKNYIKLIIDLKRHASVDKIVPIGKVFKLNKEQRHFLFFLFLKNTVKDQGLQEYIKYVISSFKSEIRQLEFNKYPMATNARVFDSWIKMAIHSMARLKQFKADPQWIKDQFNENVPLSDIKRALQDLLQEGAIKEKNGKYSPTEFVFLRPRRENPEDWQIPKQALYKSMQVFEAPQKFLPASYFMTMVSMNQKDSKKVVEKSLELRNMIIDTSKKSKDPDQVFFMLNHFFGVSK